MSLAVGVAIQIVLKATLVLIAAAAVAAAARRGSAAARHFVWACGLLVLLALPAFSLVLPAWSPSWLPSGFLAAPALGTAIAPHESAAPQVTMESEILAGPTSASPVAGATNQGPENATPAVASPMLADGLLADRVAANPPFAGQPQPARGLVPFRAQRNPETPDLDSALLGTLRALEGSWSWYRGEGRSLSWLVAYRAVSKASPAWLGAIWLAGAAIMAGGLGAGFWQRSRLARRALALRAGPCVEAACKAAEELELRRPVTVLHGRSRTVPMTWGYLRPILYLPAEAASWSRARLRTVALHELAHVKRVDSVSRTIAQAACAVFWFHPLAWLAARRMLAEQERACDDIVLLAGVTPHAYAETLVAIAREFRAPRPAVAGALALARRSNLESRLLSILDPLTRRQKMTNLRRSLLLTTFVLAALPMAALRPASAGLSRKATTAQAPAPPAQATARPQEATTTTPAPRTASTVAVTTAPQVAATAQQDVAPAAGDIRIQARGVRRLRADIDRVELDDDGWLRISEGDRHLEVEARDGGLEISYLVADQSADLDTEAREWADEILRYVSRRMTLRGNIFVSFEREEMERSPAGRTVAVEIREIVMPNMAPLPPMTVEIPQIVFPEIAPLAPFTFEAPEIVMPDMAPLPSFSVEMPEIVFPEMAPLPPFTVEIPEIVIPEMAPLPPFTVEIPEIVIPDIAPLAMAMDLPSLAIAGDFVRSSGWTDEEGNRFLAVWLGRVRIAETIDALEMGPDGLLLIDERAADGTHRRLYITGEEDAPPRFEWLVDGEEQPFDAAGRAWLEPILRELAERRQPGAR